MKHPKSKDHSTIVYNDRITVSGIPDEAWEYQVSGHPALWWVMQRQAIRTHKASGIVNDANRYAIETVGDPAYPLKLLLRVIRVAIETQRIVNALPDPEEPITSNRVNKISRFDTAASKSPKLSMTLKRQMLLRPQLYVCNILLIPLIHSHW